MAFTNFIPNRDIPDQSGKVVLITGGTAGLGSQTITELSKHKVSRVIFTGRNKKAADDLIKQVKASSPSVDISFQSADFTSLKSVQDAGRQIAATTPHIDILFCNAGVMAIPKGLTKDGYENQFGINHLAHAMLIKTLLPVLESSSAKPGADVRIICNTSLGAFFAHDIDFKTIRTEQDSMILGAFRRYGQSKLANILYAQQLAKHYPAITTVTIHPGIIYTGLVTTLSTFNRYFTYVTTIGNTMPIEEGVKNQLWAAITSKDKLENGAFYEPVG